MALVLNAGGGGAILEPYVTLVSSKLKTKAKAVKF